MRLDKLLSTLALGTRSQVKEMLRAGRIIINGVPVRNADFRVEIGDSVALDGMLLDARTQRHIMLNKPCGVLTAARDAKQPTVLDLLPLAFKSCGCMPVGRLDKDTEGLLLLTTDGALSHLLLSPKRHVWKCYLAEVTGRLQSDDISAFEDGIALSDFDALPAKMEIIDADNAQSTAKVWVREGKYHQVRRMFAALGHEVTALKRLSFGPLTLDPSLRAGEYRELTADEVQALLQAVSGEKST